MRCPGADRVCANLRVDVRARSTPSFSAAPEFAGPDLNYDSRMHHVIACIRTTGAACILVLTLAGCDDEPRRTQSSPVASSPSGSGPSGSNPQLSKAACYDLEGAAQQAAAPALDANQACKVASDCISMQFSASCFQACDRLVATSGVAAVEAAIATVEGAQCKAHRDGGCVLIQPPCAPRPPPPYVCTAGVCAYSTY